MFKAQDYKFLHSMVFRDDYPGYKPSVVEIPNGDGKADAEKRYAHVAPKYVSPWPEDRDDLEFYSQYAHSSALAIARMAGIPEKFWPRIEYGALRVLEYPPGAVSHMHEDFDLFTLMCYRNKPDHFQSFDVEAHEVSDTLRKIRAFNPLAHMGQLGEAIGLGPATPHSVLASDDVQHAIVYFAIPDHDAVLPNGMTVRDWLNERMARSRTEFKAYR